MSPKQQGVSKCRNYFAGLGMSPPGCCHIVSSDSPLQVGAHPLLLSQRRFASQKSLDDNEKRANLFGTHAGARLVGKVGHHHPCTWHCLSPNPTILGKPKVKYCHTPNLQKMFEHTEWQRRVLCMPCDLSALQLVSLSCRVQESACLGMEVQALSEGMCACARLVVLHLWTPTTVPLPRTQEE